MLASAGSQCSSKVLVVQDGCLALAVFILATRCHPISHAGLPSWRGSLISITMLDSRYLHPSFIATVSAD